VNVTVTSSLAGIIIPPSHNMIIFAIAAGGGISISQLFLAGIAPGVLMCLCLAAAAYVVAVRPMSSPCAAATAPNPFQAGRRSR